MTTFRDLINSSSENGISLASLNSSGDTVSDISPYAVLSMRKLDVDAEALKLKSADEELTEDEVLYVQRLEAGARSLSSGQAAFNASVGHMIQIRDKANSTFTNQKSTADSFYSKTASFQSYTDPDA